MERRSRIARQPAGSAERAYARRAFGTARRSSGAGRMVCNPWSSLGPMERGGAVLSFERVDPGGILLAFRRRAAGLAGERPGAPFTRFQLAMGLILLLRDGDLDGGAGAAPSEFGQIRGSVAADLAIARHELERLEGLSAGNAEVVMSLVELVDLMSWFVEGGDAVQRHGSEIARILSGIS